MDESADRLQRVLNAAACVVSGTQKYDRGLSRLLHTELHWLDVSERVKYKLSIMVHSCLKGQAHQYLIDFCLPRSAVTSRQRLRSASRQLLDVPRYRLSTFARRAFSVVSPSVWNSLPEYLRVPAVGRDKFQKTVEKVSVCNVLVNTAHQRFYDNALNNYSHYIYITFTFTHSV